METVEAEPQFSSSPAQPQLDRTLIGETVEPLMYESNHARIDNQTIKAKHAKQLLTF